MLLFQVIAPSVRGIQNIKVVLVSRFPRRYEKLVLLDHFGRKKQRFLSKSQAKSILQHSFYTHNAILQTYYFKC